MEFVEHLEGGTRLLVPRASLTQDPPPTAPVFFNPAASLNRDISVVITAAAGGTSFCDSMSGVGARGLRVAREVGRIEKVAMVDFNSEALKAAEKAAGLNGVAGKCEFSASETCTYLFSRYRRDEKFDFVDVDPFGTPVRQLQAALSATADGGIVSVTATDTAVLCGVYPEVSQRRYAALSLNNDFRHETGVRVLAGALARQGAQIDIGIVPVFAHATRHYIRVFAKVVVGASNADESLKKTGHLASCLHCGHTAVSEAAIPSCPECGKKPTRVGPVWLGGLSEPRLLRSALRAAEEAGLRTAARVIGSFDGVDEFPPWSFSIERASSALKVATVSESAVGRLLTMGGWKVKRTPFEKTGLKTDAPHAEFLQAVETAARKLPESVPEAQSRGPSQK